MTLKAIANSYWRSIKRSIRTFENIPDSVKDDVRILAQADVQKGVITMEQYEQYIGETYNTSEII